MGMGKEHNDIITYCLYNIQNKNLSPCLNVHLCRGIAWVLVFFFNSNLDVYFAFLPPICNFKIVCFIVSEFRNSWAKK